MNKVALISGITGQDGSYLTELLLDINLLAFTSINPEGFKLTAKFENCFNQEQLYK